MVRVLEGASASLKMNGAPFLFGSPNGAALAPVPFQRRCAISSKAKRHHEQQGIQEFWFAALSEEP